MLPLNETDQRIGYHVKEDRKQRYPSDLEKCAFYVFQTSLFVICAAEKEKAVDHVEYGHGKSCPCHRVVCMRDGKMYMDQHYEKAGHDTYEVKSLVVLLLIHISFVLEMLQSA